MFSANQRMKKIIEWATGDPNYVDDMQVHYEEDVKVVLSQEDLYNIENEIRTAYEAGYQDANKNAEPTGHMTEEQLFQNLYRMVAGTNVTYKQVDSDLDEKGDVTIFFTIQPKGDNQ